MSEKPEHMQELSDIFWDIVDALTANGFPQSMAYKITLAFFRQFTPLPRSRK